MSNLDITPSSGTTDCFNTPVGKACEAIARVREEQGNEIWSIVLRDMTHVLRVPTEAISRESSLVEHMGFDSLDVVELVVRLEESCGVKLDIGCYATLIAATVGAGLHTDGCMSSEARAQLRRLMPEIDDERMRQVQSLEEIISLFTGETLVRLIAWHKSQGEM